MECGQSPATRPPAHRTHQHRLGGVQLRRQTLASGSGDRSVRPWNVSQLGDPASYLCRFVAQSFARDQWQALFRRAPSTAHFADKPGPPRPRRSRCPTLSERPQESDRASFVRGLITTDDGASIVFELRGRTILKVTSRDGRTLSDGSSPITRATAG
jgi:hypothetical protein